MGRKEKKKVEVVDETERAEDFPGGDGLLLLLLLLLWWGRLVGHFFFFSLGQFSLFFRGVVFGPGFQL